jgi:hypothetical protein
VRTTNIFFVMSDELADFRKLQVCSGPDDSDDLATVEQPYSLSNKFFWGYLHEFQKRISVDFNFKKVISGRFLGNTWKGVMATIDHNVIDEYRSLRDINYIPTGTLRMVPKSGGNGRVLLEQLERSMETPFERVDYPVFAVIDHNSAHHMSYVLAKNAFSKFALVGEDRKKVVINFDNHADGNEPKPDHTTIHCNNWAYHFFLDHGKAGSAVNPIYISLGSYGQRLFKADKDGRSTENGDTFVYNRGVTGACKYVTDPMADGNILVIMENIRGVTGFEWRNADVYITVDRDFMIGSYTNYGDGKYSPQVGRNAVTTCLCYLVTSGANLVGFDIIGLPTRDATKKPNDKQKLSQSFDQSVIDIRTFYSCLSEPVERIFDTIRTASASR